MPGQAIYDKEEVLFNMARIKKGGETFEIVIDPDKAVEHKEGKGVDIRDILKSEYIFSEAKRGLRASETLMKQVFGTDDSLKVAEIIIRDGEIQLTAEHRKKVREAKHRLIVEMIHRNGVDPSTHLPHPVARIESAMEEAKVRIDEFKKPEDQLDRIVSQIRVVLPIKMEVAEIMIKIPNAQTAARAYPAIKAGARIIKDDWLNDGSWAGVVELPAGLSEDFFARLNKITKGEIETQVMKTR
jgi:ribosome maturation protein SDO1